MATRPTTLVSIDGGALAPGSLTVESDGHLLDWRGDAQVFLMPGRTVRVAVFTDHAVYYGNALLNVGTVPPLDGDEPPVSGFMGYGELHRKDMSELAELLFTTVEAGLAMTGMDDLIDAERAVLEAALRWYEDHEPWPAVGPDEPEFDLKTAVEALKAERAGR